MLVNCTKQSYASLGGTSRSIAFPKHGLLPIPQGIQACPMALRSFYCNGAVALSWQQEPRRHDRYFEEAWEAKKVARGFQAMHTEDDGSDALQAVPVAHA